MTTRRRGLATKRALEIESFCLKLSLSLAFERMVRRVGSGKLRAKKSLARGELLQLRREAVAAVAAGLEDRGEEVHEDAVGRARAHGPAGRAALLEADGEEVRGADDGLEELELPVDGVDRRRRRHERVVARRHRS